MGKQTNAVRVRICEEGPTSTTKGKKRKRGEHKRSGQPPINTPTTGQLFWRRHTRKIGVIVLGSATLIGGLAASFEFVPDVLVAPDVALNSLDPFSQTFEIENKGLVAAYDLLFACSFYHFEAASQSVEINYDTTPHLVDFKFARHQIATERCEMRFSKVKVNLRSLFYRTLLKPWKVSRGDHSFLLARTDRGWNWLPEPAQQQ
jgi:hypothetical protein